jgi:shikimate dehydrogenase
MKLPDRYAVIGNPVEHSLSPAIHAAFARQCGVTLEYSGIYAPLDDFEACVAEFFAAGGCGLNVTVPFKEEAYVWVTERDPFAAVAGAVNTIVRSTHGYLGCNTDGLGLLRDLQHNHGIALNGRRLLVLGAGGAVRGVLGPLLGANPAELVIANRTQARAEALVERLEDPRLKVVSLEALRPGYDVIINGTSAGLGGSRPEIGGELIEGAFVYDMVYGESSRAYLEHAAAHGAKGVRDGLGMLVEQAAEAFLLWFGIRPDTLPVLASLRERARKGAQK